MFEMPMAAFRPHFNPSVLLEQTDHLAYFHRHLGPSYCSERAFVQQEHKHMAVRSPSRQPNGKIPQSHNQSSLAPSIPASRTPPPANSPRRCSAPSSPAPAGSSTVMWNNRSGSISLTRCRVTIRFDRLHFFPIAPGRGKVFSRLTEKRCYIIQVPTGRFCAMFRGI